MMVIETKRLTNIEKAIVNPNSLRYCPTIPLIKLIGVKTETTTKVIATTAIKISIVPSIAASFALLPFSILR